DGGELRGGARAGALGQARAAAGRGVPADLAAAAAGDGMNETAHGFFADGAFAVPPLPEQERMVEAVLFASKGPLSAREIAERLPRGCDVPEALAGLRRR